MTARSQIALFISTAAMTVATLFAMASGDPPKGDSAVTDTSKACETECALPTSDDELRKIFDERATYRLQAGPFATRSEATAMAERIRDAATLQPVITQRR